MREIHAKGVRGESVRVRPQTSEQLSQRLTDLRSGNVQSWVRPPVGNDRSDLSAAETPRRCSPSKRQRTSSGASLRDLGGAAKDGGYGGVFAVSP